MQIQLLHFLQQFKQKVRVRLKDKSHTSTSGFVSYPISVKLTELNRYFADDSAGKRRGKQAVEIKQPQAQLSLRFKFLDCRAPMGLAMTFQFTSSHAYGTLASYKPRIFRSRACP